MNLINNSFKLLLIVSGLMVITARNAVHSILFLVLAFAAASANLFLLEAEFIAIVLLVVYVGAVAVLFLFVCMMLEIRSEEDRQKVISYYPISGLIGLILTLEISSLIYGNYVNYTHVNVFLEWTNLVDSRPNIVGLGSVLYAENFQNYEMAAFVLLVGMVGAITISAYQRLDVKRQVINDQNRRFPVIAKLQLI